MPLFNWDALDPSEIRKPRFYIYWLVTLPCTLLVIAVWVLWIRINNQVKSTIELVKKRQPKDKKSSRPSLGSNTSFAKWRPSLVTRRSKGGVGNQVVGDEEAELEEAGQRPEGRARGKLMSLLHIRETGKQD